MTLSVHRAVLLGAAFAFAVAAAPAAQAFQFDNAQGGVSPPQNFMDLAMPSASDPPSSKFSDSKTPTPDDGLSVHFDNGAAWGGVLGGSSFNQRYNFDRQFDRYKPGQ